MSTWCSGGNDHHDHTVLLGMMMMMMNESFVFYLLRCECQQRTESDFMSTAYIIIASERTSFNI